MSTLAAFREKDLEFVSALLDARLLDIDTLATRLRDTPSLSPPHRRRLLSWVEAADSGRRQGSTPA